MVAEWVLGQDDPSRPHPLVVTSPMAVLPDEAPELAGARRREQALFDKRAQHEGGFVFLAISGARWFSRSATVITTPEKSVLRYDVRQPATFDDPTVYTRPFTVTIPARKWTEEDPATGWHFDVIDAKHDGDERIVEVFERVCVENNGGFGMPAAKP